MPAIHADEARPAGIHSAGVRSAGVRSAGIRPAGMCSAPAPSDQPDGQPKPTDPVHVGQQLPPLLLPPVNRTMLALFAGASGDHNPIHIDIDFARRAGMPDVFAQGMLGMAWLCRLVTTWLPQRQLRQVDARFVGITHLGHQIRCVGEVTEIVTIDDERCARLTIRTVNQYGQTRIAGEAVVAVETSER